MEGGEPQLSAALRKPYSKGRHNPLPRKSLSWLGCRLPGAYTKAHPISRPVQHTPRGLPCQTLTMPAPHTTNHPHTAWEVPRCGTPHGSLCLSLPALMWGAPGVIHNSMVPPSPQPEHLIPGSPDGSHPTSVAEHPRAVCGTRHRPSSERNTRRSRDQGRPTEKRHKHKTGKDG